MTLGKWMNETMNRRKQQKKMIWMFRETSRGQVKKWI